MSTISKTYFYSGVVTVPGSSQIVGRFNGTFKAGSQVNHMKIIEALQQETEREYKAKYGADTAPTAVIMTFNQV